MKSNPGEEQSRHARFKDFLVWFKANITGKERREGQIFFDRLLQAFGNAGVLEAGAVCEDPIKKKTGKIGFADLVWRPRVIIELKERGTKLKKHYPQAEEYWMRLVPNRPQFMILCNFDEFWIYDLNTQLNDPVHQFKLENLASDWGALAFLFPFPEKPIFNNNNVEVTEQAANIVGSMYLELKKRKVDPERAQRFVLQLVVALFSEDVGLIPKYTLHKILKEAVKNPVTQKELQELFEAMAEEKSTSKPKKYKDIPYFNGGLFSSVEPVELSFKELDLLHDASKQDWSKVRPSVFGSIFEGSMDPDHRHGHGIHFTSELDIQKIVNPTIIRPFRERIEKTKDKKELNRILKEIQSFKVLDPACGSGNFLYVAFRELRRLEIEIIEKIQGSKFNPNQLRFGWISPKNFHGIDTNKFGLELAKIALCIGRKLSADEFGVSDNVLPFDNLDTNFSDKDAILSEWPDADAIIGNPPFQSKNKMLQEFGGEYLNRIREKMPEVSGYADYCVYWFRKAHNHLGVGKRAGLVGTNTIRQNQSRESGLDYIVQSNGTITEAVGTQVWSGDAVVHVSIVNWIKGSQAGKKRLYQQLGDRLDSPWDIKELDVIPATLSPRTDVTSAKQISTGANSYCFQGQTPGHEGFMLSVPEAEEIFAENPEYKKVIFPFLIGDDILGSPDRKPSRYVIDFGEIDINQASEFGLVFSKIKNSVLPWRQQMAAEEAKRNAEIRKKNPRAKIDRQYANSLTRWWALRRTKSELISELKKMPRYIATSRVTKRPIFEFVSNSIHPGDSLQTFLLSDDYSFGILQSNVHWVWFVEKCSTLKGDARYTSESVFDTFPWPQSPSAQSIKSVAEAGVHLRYVRDSILQKGKSTLREIYRNLELPGKNPLRDSHEELNVAVLQAYGFKSADTILDQLLQLNLAVSSSISAGHKIQGPGVPECVKKPESFFTLDCIIP